MVSKAKTLFKGSALRIFGFFMNAIIALFLMPFIIHSLGDRMYGLWVIVGSFLGFYWLFDFGLNSAVQRYVSRAIGNKDYNEVQSTINTSLFLFSIIGLVTLIISFVIAFTVPLFMKNITEVTLFRKIIIILGCSFAIGFPMRVFSGILISHIRYDLITSIGILKLLIRTVLIVIFLKMGYGILILALITLVTDLIDYIITFILAMNVAKYIILSKTLIDKTKIKSLFNYSSFTFIIHISDNLRFNIDNFVIVIFMGLNLVTLYSIASRLIKYFMDFIISAMGIMLPVFSQYESKGDYISIREKYILTTKISAYLSFLVGGTLVIFGKAFIYRWVGEEYLAAYPILIVLLIAIITDLMQNPSIGLLYGISKHKFLAIINVIEGTINLILSLILVRKFGLIGVALGTAIPMILIKIFIQPIYTCRVIKLDISKYYFKIIIPALLKSIAIFVILWIMFRNIIVPNYSNLLILISCEFVLFLSMVFFVGLTDEEKSYFKKVIFK